MSNNCQIFYIQINSVTTSCSLIYNLNTNFIPGKDAFNEFEIIHLGRNETNCREGRSLCSFYNRNCYLNEKRCVFERDIHGDPVHCLNTEHLRFCGNVKCPGMYRCKSSFCVPIHMVCDQIDDCPGKEDEINCPTRNIEGLFHCSIDNIFIPFQHVCDSVIHCLLSQDDEFQCETINCVTTYTAQNYVCACSLCNCRGYSIMCEHISLAELILPNSLQALYLNNITHLRQQDLNHPHLLILDISNSSIGFLPTNLMMHLFSLIHLNLQNTSLVSLHTKPFHSLTKLQTLNLQDNYIIILHNEIFQGLLSLSKLDLHNLGISEIYVNAFLGLEYLSQLNISYNRIAYLSELVFTNIVVLRVLDISNNPINSVDFNNYQQLRIVDIFSDDVVRCCFVSKCSKRESELYNFCNPVIYPTFKYCYWVGCIFVIILTLLNLYYHIKMAKRNAQFPCIVLLFLNNFISALILLYFCIVDYIYKHNFPLVLEDVSKSKLCNLIMMFMIISQMTPKMLILTMSVIHYRVVCRVLHKSVFKTKHILQIICILWLIIVLIACLWTYFLNITTIMVCVPFHNLHRHLNFYILIATILLLMLTYFPLVLSLLISFHIAKYMRLSELILSSSRQNTTLKYYKKSLCRHILYISVSLPELLMIIHPEILIGEYDMSYSLIVFISLFYNSCSNNIIHGRLLKKQVMQILK